MGLRDKLNDNPSLVTAVTAAIIVASLAFMAIQLGLLGDGGRGATPRIFLVDPDADGNAYRVGTRDDLFANTGEDRPVAAHLVEPAGGGEPVVWYHERAIIGDPERVAFAATEIRRPTDRRWVPIDSVDAERILAELPSDADGPMIVKRP